MTSIDARSNITFHMGNIYVSFCHRHSAKMMGSDFGHVFYGFLNIFPPFFYSKKSLKLIPLFHDLLIQWGSVPEKCPSRGDAQNIVSNGHNMLKIALNTKFHERLQCVLCRFFKDHMTWKTLGVGDFTVFVRDRFVPEGYGVRVKALTTS